MERRSEGMRRKGEDGRGVEEERRGEEMSENRWRGEVMGGEERGGEERTWERREERS